jgi:hypothetical protein
MKSESKKGNIHSKRWVDPVKGKAANEETMQTRGDFAEFTENMRRLMRVRPEAKPASRVRASS